MRNKSCIEHPKCSGVCWSMRREQRVLFSVKYKNMDPFNFSVHNSPQQPLEGRKIVMAYPTSANSSLTKSAIPNITSVQIMPKMMKFKIVKPKIPLACTSVLTRTTNSTPYLTTAVPLNSSLNNSNPSRIQSQTVIHESPSITVVPTTSSIQHTPTIVPTINTLIDSDDEKENTSVFNKDGHFIWDHKTIMLFFTEYEEHEKKLQKKKYQSKEAMFQALAESFQKKGYLNANKNHIKNKFKLLKKKWDMYIKRTIGKNSSGKGMKPLKYENEMVRIFGKSHSGVPSFIAGRNEIVSQEKVLQKIKLNLLENENEEQSSTALLSPSSTVSEINSKSQPTTENSTPSMTNSSSSSIINPKVKVRDGKLALTLQSVKESICAALERESDAKQEARIQFLTELKKCNELQKERNTILQKQLRILERFECNTQKELSDEEN